jgi:integrase
MTVRKRQGTKSTRWQASWKKPDGSRGFKDFPTKQLALAFENKMKSDLLRGDYANPRFAKTMVREVFEDLKSTWGNLKPKTTDDYQGLWVNMIEPVWGNKRLSDINRTDFKVWVNHGFSRTGKKVSASRIRKSAVVLNAIINHAIERELINKNPLGKYRNVLPRHEIQSQRKVLEFKELIKLADVCGKYRLMILLAGLLGLRWGEVIGLKANDINFKSNTIRISRSISEVNGKIYEATTKSGKARIVPIPKQIQSDLKTLVLEREEGSPLFVSHNQKWLRKSNFSRRIFKPAVIQSGVSRITFHELRHTAVSIQLSNGTDPITVSKLAGHSSPATTLKVYAHELANTNEKILNVIDLNFEEIA